MKPQQKEKACRECGESFRPFNSLEKYCSWDCQKKNIKPNLKLKPLYKIPQKSKKRQIEDLQYSVKRIEFLSNPENQKCFIETCNNKATTIEHRKNRIGYADEWARENGISLYLDVRFWAPCCLPCNLELENNSELAKKYKLSKLHDGKRE